MRRSQLWFSILIMSSQLNTACGQKTFDEKMQSMYRNTVPLVQAEDVAERQKQNDDLILLDIRSAREFEVSHLEGARFIDYDEFDSDDVKEIPMDAEIVVYCAVGYRSERVGEKLQELGFQNVRNLYGGIFDWKNNNHTVVNEQGVETDSVHTYNKNWAQWLYNGIKVYD